MAGRVLLVCALCVVCCAGGGVGAWGSGYCTESDWRDLRAVAKDMTDTEIERKYCSRKPEFVKGLRASPQEGGTVSGTGQEGTSSTGATEGTQGNVQTSQEKESSSSSDSQPVQNKGKENTEQGGAKGGEGEQSRAEAPAAPQSQPHHSHSHSQGTPCRRVLRLAVHQSREKAMEKPEKKEMMAKQKSSRRKTLEVQRRQRNKLTLQLTVRRRQSEWGRALTLTRRRVATVTAAPRPRTAPPPLRFFFLRVRRLLRWRPREGAVCSSSFFVFSVCVCPPARLFALAPPHEAHT
ncbi:hypothetical protein TraAM80_09267 [Trypanosoma rangeli]|uniref:Mucin-associated surface protein (MASP) n=1 Tax=Trypanosoma rangeli TaxID=5698 RepID=A0A3R7JYQ3_TRYRA|nr:uncharacterized protein TraAM80_09267 [Trypanosoma rangeli]RNE97579.1 hypothetical protein TraAM80_09267 [Trypanosoma rangeli]|eukprot:RNE97579.1 hypothetical protein TraAM80_09267 [Trypanosoma rangeli]